MPINGEIFLKKMDQFVESTGRHISTTEKLLKRMEDFFELEDEKQKQEQKLLNKRVYVKVKDPLEEISSKIGTSNILLQDILKALKEGKGRGGDGDFDLKSLLPLGLAGALAALTGNSTALNKFLQKEAEFAVDIGKKFIPKISAETGEKVIKKVGAETGEKVIKKVGAEATEAGGKAFLKTLSYTADDVVEIGGKKLIKNAAGRWIEKGTGRFITREVAEQAEKELAERAAKKAGGELLKKTLTKIAPKAGKLTKILKGIPVLNIAVAIPFIIKELKQGDMEGALLELLTVIPVAGWGFVLISIFRDLDDSGKKKFIETLQKIGVPIPEEIEAWLLNNTFLNSAKKLSKGEKTVIEGEKTVIEGEKTVIERVNEYDSIVQKMAEKYNVDPDTIKSIIAQESSGVASRKSLDPKSTARGLGQITKPTERLIEKRLKRNIDVFNPEDAIEGIAFLYRNAYDRYKSQGYSDEEANYLAILDHNYGARNVKLMLEGRENEITDPVDKNYLNRILGFRSKFQTGKVNQKSATEGLEFNNVNPDSSISAALSELRGLFSSGVTLSDASIKKLGAEIDKNMPRVTNSPIVLDINSRK